jgi:hypothetical protein
MPTRRAIVSSTALCAALVASTGCAEGPERTDTRAVTELPELPIPDLGTGLDTHVERERRMQEPGPVELPEVPAERGFESFMEHARSGNVFDLDSAYDITRLPPAPDEDDAEQRVDLVTATPEQAIELDEKPALDAAQANGTARLARTALDPLVGGPVDPFDDADADAPERDEPENAIEALVRELEALLATDAERADLPLAPALRLAALESIDPGALARTFGALDDNDPFTPDERAVVDAWARLHERLADAETAPDPTTLARALREAAEETAALLPMRVDRLELCRSVRGFGDFTPLYRREGAVVLPAGMAHRMIVYAELARFGVQEDTRDGVEGFEVDLMQDIELIHLDRGEGEADLVAWSHPDERITDFSRNRRRDFYTLQIIELPATLSIGRYHLRLTVRDVATGEEAQSVVPIDVVAQVGSAER